MTEPLFQEQPVQRPPHLHNVREDPPDLSRLQEGWGARPGPQRLAAPEVEGVVRGKPAWAALRSAARHPEVGSVVLILDPALAGWVPRVEEACAPRPLHLHVCPPHEPTFGSVDEAADRVRTAPAPLVVGLGGGSALDTAKLAAALARGGTRAADHALGARDFGGRFPLVAMPTTAGTGAEVTRACVMTAPDGRKQWAWSEHLRPDAALLLPELTASVPRPVAVASGLDALVHAVEAATSQGSNPKADGLALQAAVMIFDHLPQAVNVPGNEVARSEMLLAACLAGQAFDLSALGAAHAVAHALGSLSKLPHGLAVAVALAAVLPWNVERAPERHRRLAGALGCEVADLPHRLRALYAAVDLPGVLGRYDLDLEADRLADALALPEQLPLLRTNAAPVSPDEHADLARHTLDAWERLRAGEG